MSAKLMEYFNKMPRLGSLRTVSKDGYEVAMEKFTGSPCSEAVSPEQAGNAYCQAAGT